MAMKQKLNIEKSANSAGNLGLAVWSAIGVGMGVALGGVFQDPPLGMALGASVGVIIGMLRL